MAAHIALYEIGVPFEGRPISFARREQQNPEFLAINPEGKVPTLVVDGRQMTEVAAILYYLAKRFPDAALLPKDDIETDAQAISWMSFIASTLHPARKQGMDHVIKVYSVADRRLGEKIWALGTYSIADIHLFSPVLADVQFFQARSRPVSKSFRALRSHDVSTRGPANAPCRGRHRI